MVQATTMRSLSIARPVAVALAAVVSSGLPSPDCWDGEINEALCCNERWGLMGNIPCWDSEFTYVRCCGLDAFPRQLGDDAAWDKEKASLPSSDGDEFDFIIVGAGSAGSTLAARLAAAEGPDGLPWRVLLIEEGPPDRPEAIADPDRLPESKDLWRAPLNVSWKIDGAERIWPYATGQGLGGSARVNSMIYMRGSLDEYAHFGWDVSEVLSAFKALEAPMEVPGFAVDETFHKAFPFEQGLGGTEEIPGYHLTLISATQDELPRFFRALISAFEDAGVPFRLDPHSSRSMHGIGGTWRSMGCGHARCQPSRVSRFIHAKGRPRSSTYSSLTAPTLARGRQRLRVLTNAKVERVVFNEERRAVGVQVLLLPADEQKDGDMVATDPAEAVPRPQRVFYGADAEVIVSAGVFGSPKLLTLSGVAEPEELKRLGIPLVAGSPEVGRHLHEHVGVSILIGTMVPCPEGYHKVDGASTHLGHLDEFIGQFYAFMNATATHETPGASGALDVEIMMLEGCYDGRLSLTFTVMLLQSMTRGRIVVQSRSPHTPPHVDYQPLSVSEDIDTIAAAIRRLYVNVLAAPALAEFGLTVIPSTEVVADGSTLMYWIRSSLWYYSHPGGTCRVDRANYPGVVDSQFRVLGTLGLRVVDASVFPVSPSAHSDGPSRLSGELAARAVLRQWVEDGDRPPAELEEGSRRNRGLSVRLHGYRDVWMPLVGFGTAGFTGERLMISLSHFFRLGGRLIDTASLYQNHRDVASAMTNSGLPRHEIFIISKISPDDMGREAATAAIERMVDELGTYIDLLLIHWPAHFVPNAKLPPCAQGDDGSWRRCRAATWQAMEAAQRAGWVQALGVSNFGKRHLSELLDEPDRTLPIAANEVEFHPWWPQPPLVEFCKARNVQLVAYGSMGNSLLGGAMLKAPDVVRAAAASGKSPAQVLLRWALQQGVAVIPASASPEHIAENLDLASWELDDATMTLLAVPRQSHMRVYQPDPEGAP